MSKVCWYLRQLLPLTYRTGDGAPRFAVWKMWLGRVFAHDDVAIAE
jgi:hypothetical protein